MMRRILMMLTLWSVMLMAQAQQRLHIGELLDGKVVSKTELAAIGGVEVKVKGRALNRYSLDFYHSFHFIATADQKRRIDELVEADRHNAVSSEVTRKGRGVTTILTMTPDGGNNRFICYIAKPRDKRVELTVVYMEGKVRSINDLRKLIK